MSQSVADKASEYNESTLLLIFSSLIFSMAFLATEGLSESDGRLLDLIEKGEI